MILLNIIKENLFFSQSMGVGLLELDLKAQPTGSNPRISICEIKKQGRQCILFPSINSL